MPKKIAPARRLTPQAPAAPVARRATAPNPTAPTSPANAAFPRKVRATSLGFYGHIRRRVGDVFTCERAQDFSSKWMEPVSVNTPERVTTGRQALQQQHDEILAGKTPAMGTPLVDDEPLADFNPLSE